MCKKEQPRREKIYIHTLRLEQNVYFVIYTEQREMFVYKRVGPITVGRDRRKNEYHKMNATERETRSILVLLRSNLYMYTRLCIFLCHFTSRSYTYMYNLFFNFGLPLILCIPNTFKHTRTVSEERVREREKERILLLPREMLHNHIYTIMIP